MEATPSAAKCEQIVREFFKKAVHVIVNSRCYATGSSDPLKINKWFNLESHELPTVSGKVAEVQQSIHTPVLVDVHYNDSERRVLLERWSLELDRGHAIRPNEMPVVYKQLIVCLRSLCTQTRILPAYRVFRKCAEKSMQGRISYDIHSLGEPLMPSPREVQLAPVGTPLGSVTIRITYAANAGIVPPKSDVDNRVCVVALISEDDLNEDFFASPRRRRQTVAGDTRTVVVNKVDAPGRLSRQQSSPSFPDGPHGGGARRPRASSSGGEIRIRSATTSPPSQIWGSSPMSAPTSSPASSQSRPLYRTGSVSVHDGDASPPGMAFKTVPVGARSPPFSFDAAPTGTSPVNMFSMTPPFGSSVPGVGGSLGSAPRTFAFSVTPFKNGQSSSLKTQGLTFEKIDLSSKPEKSPSDAVNAFMKQMQQAPPLKSFPTSDTEELLLSGGGGLSRSVLDFSEDLEQLRAQKGTLLAGLDDVLSSRGEAGSAGVAAPTDASPVLEQQHWSEPPFDLDLDDGHSPTVVSEGSNIRSKPAE